MKKLLPLLILLFFYDCSSPEVQREEARGSEENDQKILKAIHQGVYTDFQEAIQGDHQEDYQFHNYLASTCSSQERTLTEQMAKTLIERGIQPLERSFAHYKAPLQTAISRGCLPLVALYLDHLSPQEIADFSLDLKATDFIHFTEQISQRDPLSSELSLLEEGPLSVDLAIQRNSQLCQNQEDNCQARDHLLEELGEMKKAVAKLAYQKACSVQIEMVNTLQSMNEQIEFARATGVASAATYRQEVKEAQELRAWYHYYDTLFFKMTGESADLGQCYL